MSIFSYYKLTWTPQLLQLVAEIIREPNPTDDLQKLALVKFQKFHIYWSVFNKRLRKAKIADVDLLYLKIVHLKAAICYWVDKFKELMGIHIHFTQEEKIIIERVGLAHFVKERLVFTHYSWAEFLFCLALLSPKGMLEKSFFGVEIKGFVFFMSREVLTFLNQAIETDLEDEDFAVENFLEDQTLITHLTFNEFTKNVVEKNLKGIYFRYVVKKIFPNYTENIHWMLDQLLYAVCCPYRYNSFERDEKLEDNDIENDLCQRGADINRLFQRLDSYYRKSLLTSLARYNNSRLLQQLISTIKNHDDFMNQTLHTAVELDSVECVKLLVENGANLNVVLPQKFDKIWMPPNGHVQINTTGESLHMAACSGSKRVFQFLLKQPGMDINLPSSCDGKTPLHFAAEGAQVQMVEWLLDQEETNPKAVDKKGWNALHHAVHLSGTEVIEVLLKRGFDINAVTHLGENVFHLAGDKQLYSLFGDRQNPIDLILEKGVNVYQEKIMHTNEKGEPEPRNLNEGLTTALHYAAFLDHVELTKRILKEKIVKVDAKDGFGSTAIYWTRSLEIVKLLIDARTDINATTPHTGKSVLQHKIESLSADIVERLLQEETLDVNHKDKIGKTALHEVLEKEDESKDERYYKILQLLLEREDIDVEAQTEEGLRPIDLATDEKSLKMMEIKLKGE